MRSPTTRLILLLLLALTVITGVDEDVRLFRKRERLVEQTRRDERIFAETLALAVQQNVRRGRAPDSLQGLIQNNLAQPDVVGIAIYNPVGEVVAERVAPGLPPLIPDETVRHALAMRQAASLPVEGVSSGLRYIQPFGWPQGRTGAIEVRHSLADTEREYRRAIQESILSGLVVLALFVLSGVALTRWSIVRPIRALIAGARAVGRADLAQPIDVRRRDGFGQLAEEFDRMSASLQVAHEERQRLEREVQQAQKLAAVGMLAAEIAHEIGTPLNVISGRAEVLGKTVGPDHSGRRHLDVILQQTERITGTLRALLDYARPRRPSLRAQAVVPILGRVADLLLDRSRRRRVRIELDASAGLPQVLADPDQLQQLFLNLLSNALDASPPGETVRVAVGPVPMLPAGDRAGIVRGKADGLTLAIHVLNSGKGLTADQLDHVFEPFFSTKAQGQGTGLGLPIVEQIVRAHRGEIEMLSIPERGTEVIVRLPLASKAAGDPVPALEECVSGAGRHGR
ncbi:MAG TPA: ATP-binding protein [Candidatus Methylomirabilis sp.]|nr:ATP-binding protein [Candidatus Methylomirabilis sp.]